MIKKKVESSSKISSSRIIYELSQANSKGLSSWDLGKKFASESADKSKSAVYSKTSAVDYWLKAFESAGIVVKVKRKYILKNYYNHVEKPYNFIINGRAVIITEKDEVIMLDCPFFGQCNQDCKKIQDCKYAASLPQPIQDLLKSKKSLIASSTR
jgi:hypothetical protein